LTTHDDRTDKPDPSIDRPSATEGPTTPARRLTPTASDADAAGASPTGVATARTRRRAQVAAFTAVAALALTVGAAPPSSRGPAPLARTAPGGDGAATAEGDLTTSPAGVSADMIDTADRAIAAARADRSLDRGPLTLQAEEPEVVGRRFTTADLNVRTKPDEDAKVVAVLDYGDKVSITDEAEDGWRQVVYKDEARWVKSAYLSREKPKPRPKGPSSAPCPASSGGSGMEGGLTSNAVKVHRAVCGAFPSVTTYGGIRGSGGNHGTGHAVDIMVSGGTGDAIAAYVRAHAGALGVTEVIWSQRIWTTQRSGEGWRGMSDRGSTTANHYDHVHVTVR
jgi:uncharacterized protein YgiM (DUF1202 family)